MGFFNRFFKAGTAREQSELAGKIHHCLRGFAWGMEGDTVRRRTEGFASMAILTLAVTRLVERHGMGALTGAVEQWALATGDGPFRRWVATWFTDPTNMTWLIEQMQRFGEDRVTGLKQFQEGLNAAGLSGPSLLDAEAALARQKKPRRGDPGRTIAEALWPRSKQESGLRQRIAELTGAGPTHAGLELFILRDHAFEAAHFARFKKFPQDTGFGIRVYGLVDARMNRVLSEPRVMHWVSARSLVYWEAIASVTSASTAEQLAEMQRQIGAVFEQAFEQSGTALALIGAAEYDSAFTRFVEVCEQVTGE